MSGQICDLFVYGTLMNKRIRSRVLQRDPEHFPATLPQYATGFTDGLPYVIRTPQTNTRVYGYLLKDISPEEFTILDHYEQAPVLYTREVVTVWTDGWFEAANDEPKTPADTYVYVGALIVPSSVRCALR